ncbi:hypothetical protein [Streptomyces sp. NBC_01187]|uniref:hypothetical protein n=1 Tax=Streptomyces sp. NBC_01187 TaxID=2903766 RepID=UPI003869EE56|nr:hypothetical protein OG220_20450 [Streptomyces sp. NBC_01187]
MKRFAAVALAVVSIATLGATTASAAGTTASTADVTRSSSLQGVCGDDYDIQTSGGRVAASLWCSNGKIHVDGWVKDTDRDGQCAIVSGNIGSTDFSSKACGNGKKKEFHSSGKGSTANIYLREE